MNKLAQFSATEQEIEILKSQNLFYVLSINIVLNSSLNISSFTIPKAFTEWIKLINTSKKISRKQDSI